jgi:alkanesulfonate monooxygenase SsuD/methylene tetrahydromethanopterin reductase-like flavin-dependent oxidoreductase (luciferase family)
MIDVGVGLWNLRSTAERPRSVPGLYAQLREDARVAESLGFHSLWLSEHHFWYDGWCPAPLTAAAMVLGATDRLAVGTGVHLLSLWEPEMVASAVETLSRLAPERLQLGVGLGYRDEEFDGFGVSRRTRGRRMDAALDRLGERWQAAGAQPPILVGGFSEPALVRAATRGLGILLPFSMEITQLTRTVERYRKLALDAGRPAGRIGTLKYAWPTDGGALERRRAREAIVQSAREYSGAWFPLRGTVGFESPALLEGQLRRGSETALIGTPAQIADGIAELEGVGVDLVVLQATRDGLDVDYRQALERLAEAIPAGTTAP